MFDAARKAKDPKSYFAFVAPLVRRSYEKEEKYFLQTSLILLVNSFDYRWMKFFLCDDLCLMSV